MPLRPNPFNPVTTITYTTWQPRPVNLSIYDVEGRLVETLVDAKTQEPKEYRLDWRPPGATGIYFVRLVAAGETRYTKVVLLK